MAAFGRYLVTAYNRLPRYRAQKQKWGPETTELAASIAARNCERDSGERTHLSREVAHD